MSEWHSGQRVTAQRLNFAPGMLIFAAKRTTSQTTTSSLSILTANQIQWTSIDYDPWTGWDAGSPQHYEIQEPGWYECLGALTYAASSGGTVRGACWMRNDFALQAGQCRPHVTTTLPASFFPEVVARPLPLALQPGDTIALAAVQNSGGDLDTQILSDLQPHIALTWVAPL